MYINRNLVSNKTEEASRCIAQRKMVTKSILCVNLSFSNMRSLAMIRPSRFAHDNESMKGIWSSRLALLTFVDEKLRDIHSVISFYGRMSCNIFNG